MEQGSQRVADRFLIRLAVRQVCGTDPSFRRRAASLRDLTPAVLESLVGSFWVPRRHKEALFGNILQRVKQLWGLFQKAPKVWEKFKRLIGIESLADIPAALKDLAKKGFGLLRKVFEKAFTTWPLKLYTLGKEKLDLVNGMIQRLFDKFPGFQRWLTEKAKPFLHSVEHWLRKYLPGLTPLLFAAVYIWIWLNVVEFEWDWKSIAAGFTGQVTLVELFGSLPGSAIGFLLNLFGLGTWNLLLPATAARVLYLLSHKILSWQGGQFTVSTKKLSEVLQTSPGEVAAVVG